MQDKFHVRSTSPNSQLYILTLLSSAYSYRACMTVNFFFHHLDDIRTLLLKRPTIYMHSTEVHVLFFFTYPLNFIFLTPQCLNHMLLRIKSRAHLKRSIQSSR
ncbi:hypothetical protein ACB092_04G022200 [Castanea dentata]